MKSKRNLKRLNAVAGETHQLVVGGVVDNIQNTGALGSALA
jgi:hypothetical protein